MKRSSTLLLAQLINFAIPSLGNINTRLDLFILNFRRIKRFLIIDWCILILFLVIAVTSIKYNPGGATALIWILFNLVIAHFMITAPKKYIQISRQFFVKILFIILIVNITIVFAAVDVTTIYLNAAFERSSLSEYNGSIRAFFPFAEPRRLASFVVFFVFVFIISSNYKSNNLLILILSIAIIYLTMSKSAIFALIALICFFSLSSLKRFIFIGAITLLCYFILDSSDFNFSRYSLPDIREIIQFFNDPRNNRISGYGWDTYITGIFIAQSIFEDSWLFGAGKGSISVIAEQLNLRRLGAQGFLGVFIEMGISGLLLHLLLFVKVYSVLKKITSLNIARSYIFLLVIQFNISGLYSFTNPMWIAQTKILIDYLGCIKMNRSYEGV